MISSRTYTVFGGEPTLVFEAGPPHDVLVYNTGQVTVYLDALPTLDVLNGAPVTPGGSKHWPRGVPLYVVCDPDATGQVNVGLPGEITNPQVIGEQLAVRFDYDRLATEISEAGTVINAPVDVTGSAVVVSGDVGILGPVDASGSDVTVSGGIEITGPVDVTGSDVTVSGDVGITGPVDVTGSEISIAGGVNITGPIDATGSTIEIDNATINQLASEISGDISIKGAPALTESYRFAGFTVPSGQSYDTRTIRLRRAYGGIRIAAFTSRPSSTSQDSFMVVDVESSPDGENYTFLGRFTVHAGTGHYEAPILAEWVRLSYQHIGNSVSGNFISGTAYQNVLPRRFDMQAESTRPGFTTTGKSETPGGVYLDTTVPAGSSREFTFDHVAGAATLETTFVGDALQPSTRETTILLTEAYRPGVYGARQFTHRFNSVIGIFRYQEQITLPRATLKAVVIVNAGAPSQRMLFSLMQGAQ